MGRKMAKEVNKEPYYKTTEYEEVIHFGGLIKERLSIQGRSIRWFSLQMNCDRSNMYKLLGRAHLDTNFILRACKILDHDFFHDASEILKQAEF
jgi:hypothetical protein